MTLYYERQVPCMRNAIFAHYRQIRFFSFLFLQNIYFLSLLACQLLTCKQTTALESNYYKTRYLTPKYVEFDPSVNFNILEEIKSNEGNFSTCISFEKLENLTFRRHCSSPGKVVSHITKRYYMYNFWTECKI